MTYILLTFNQNRLASQPKCWSEGFISQKCLVVNNYLYMRCRCRYAKNKNI